MGTTVGICSVIGFLPDVFVYPIVGHWQDTLHRGRLPQHVADGLAALCMVILFTFLLFQENTPPTPRQNATSLPHRLPASEDENLKENNNVEEIHHWNRWREPSTKDRDVRPAGKCGL
jgi:hypothetical protein